MGQESTCGWADGSGSRPHEFAGTLKVQWWPHLRTQQEDPQVQLTGVDKTQCSFYIIDFLCVILICTPAFVLFCILGQGLIKSLSWSSCSWTYDSPTSLPRVQGLQVCTTTASLMFISFFLYLCVWGWTQGPCTGYIFSCPSFRFLFWERSGLEPVILLLQAPRGLALQAHTTTPDLVLAFNVHVDMDLCSGQRRWLSEASSTPCHRNVSTG